MKAPSRSSSSFKDEINKFLKQHECGKSLTDFFVHLSDDPDRRIDKIWKKLVDDNPSIDTASERELFLKGLMDSWDCIVIANAKPTIDAYIRTVLEGETIRKKALARCFSKMSARELLALLQNTSTAATLQGSAKLEELTEALHQNKIYRLIDIRSNHNGSRPRTAFMRASRLMHRTTGKWHDNEVALLTDIAFPPNEDEDVTSTDVVRSARRGMRP